MSDKFTGRCQCGAVTFAFSNAPDFIANCYCTDCQRSSGAVMASYLRTDVSDFTLLSGSTRSFGYVADSGNTLVRSFCPDCGARLFNEKLEGFPGKMFVMLGSLDEPERIEPPMMEIFTAHRIPWTRALDVPQFWARPDADPETVKERIEQGDLPGGCG
ncbi:GFA family protein [Microbacteriaceae bacterium 4G12]